jgi:hypothetical protein
MKSWAKSLLAVLTFLCLLVPAQGAEIGNTSVFSQTDGSNNSGTVPTWAESMAPSQVNDSARALQGAVTREWNWRNVTLTSGGSADTQTLTYSVAPAAYYNGQRFAFIAGFTNTGAATLNVNSLGATAVKKMVAGVQTALSAGDITASNFYEVAYNSSGSAFIIMLGIPTTSISADLTITSTDAGASAAPNLILDRNSASPAGSDVIGAVPFKGRDSGAGTDTYAQIQGEITDPTAASEDGILNFLTDVAGTLATRFKMGAGLYYGSGSDMGANTVNATGYYSTGGLGTVLPRGHIDGLILSNNGSDAVNDIDIAAGQATSGDGTYVLNLASSLTKRIDASWAVGTNQGGLDGTESVAGTPDVSTWYHMWLIARPDTGVVDVLFSESPTSPTMPTNYTKKRRVGAVFNNSSGDIRAFDQIGDEFIWDAAIVDLDDDNPGTSAVTRTLSVPTGVKVKASVTLGSFLGTTGHGSWLSSLDSSDQAAQSITTSSLTNMAMGNAEASSYWSFMATDVWTNTSAQIRSRISNSAAASRIGIITRGWTDPRGRNE